MAIRPTYDPARTVDRRGAAKLLDLIAGRWLAESLHVVAMLGIADLLADGPKTAEYLAKASGTRPLALARVMRALAGSGVFAEEGNCFALTPTSEFLRSDIDCSMRAPAIFFGGQSAMVDGMLLECVKNGTSAYREMFGADCAEFYRDNPGMAEMFDQTTAALDTLHLTGVLKAYNFSGVTLAVEVYGGEFLFRLLSGYSSIRGILFDDPDQIEIARRKFEDARFSFRCGFVAGRGPHSIPKGADLYVLSGVIRHCDDEHALEVLTAVARAMPDGSRLILCEAPVPSRNQSYSKLSDINMLLRSRGRERTQAEYRALLFQAGLRMTKAVPTESPTGMMLLEAKP